VYHAAEDFARRMATARLIERAGRAVREAVDLSESAEDFLRLSATGPGGMALLDGREVATLLLLVRGLSLHAREARGSLNAAAELLRDVE